MTPSFSDQTESFHQCSISTRQAGEKSVIEAEVLMFKVTLPGFQPIANCNLRYRLCVSPDPAQVFWRDWKCLFQTQPLALSIERGLINSKNLRGFTEIRDTFEDFSDV